MATQIKVANEAKQDIMIANNVEIFEGLDNYGTVKSVQNGQIEQLSDVIVGEHAAGSEIKMISINPVNIDKCKLIANYSKLELTVSHIITSRPYSYPALSLKSDGIYTTPSEKMFDRYHIGNLRWSIVEYYQEGKWQL